ncbi:TetR-like C-terminal domain-containing protein [Parafrankia sp. FMc6]|uniref:TetR-like C-terminal domain-containing protein n=1 Tax=Parafrankia soli TaxID=2599596 RepID=UPI0034D519F1
MHTSPAPTQPADPVKDTLVSQAVGQAGRCGAPHILTVRRELFPQLEGGTEAGRRRALATARHFAHHRSFYRAMLTGSCAFATTRALNGVLGSLQRPVMRMLFGELDQAAVEDLTAFFSGGMAAVINDWLIDGEDPLDPEEFTDRLLRLMSVVTAGQHLQADGGHV